jgi:hypothetical protein
METALSARCIGVIRSFTELPLSFLSMIPGLHLGYLY